jgi:hypothetical protein
MPVTGRYPIIYKGNKQSEQIFFKWDPTSQRPLRVGCICPPRIPRALYLLDFQYNQWIPGTYTFSNISLDVPLSVVQFQFTNFNSNDADIISGSAVRITFESAGYNFTNDIQITVTDISSYFSPRIISASTGSMTMDIVNISLDEFGIAPTSIITLNLNSPISSFDTITISAV